MFHLVGGARRKRQLAINATLLTYINIFINVLCNLIIENKANPALRSRLLINFLKLITIAL